MLTYVFTYYLIRISSIEHVQSYAKDLKCVFPFMMEIEEKEKERNILITKFLEKKNRHLTQEGASFSEFMFEKINLWGCLHAKIVSNSKII